MCGGCPNSACWCMILILIEMMLRITTTLASNRVPGTKERERDCTRSRTHIYIPPPSTFTAFLLQLLQYVDLGLGARYMEISPQRNDRGSFEKSSHETRLTHPSATYTPTTPPALLTFDQSTCLLSTAFAIDWKPTDRVNSLVHFGDALGWVISS